MGAPPTPGTEGLRGPPHIAYSAACGAGRANDVSRPGAGSNGTKRASVSEISATQPEQQVYVPVAYGLHDLRPKESELSLNRIAASVSLL